MYQVGGAWWSSDVVISASRYSFSFVNIKLLCCIDYINYIVVELSIVNYLILIDN